jgi:hypothetical protein
MCCKGGSTGAVKVRGDDDENVTVDDRPHAETRPFDESLLSSRTTSPKSGHEALSSLTGTRMMLLPFVVVRPGTVRTQVMEPERTGFCRDGSPICRFRKGTKLEIESRVALDATGTVIIPFPSSRTYFSRLADTVQASWPSALIPQEAGEEGRTSVKVRGGKSSERIRKRVSAVVAKLTVPPAVEDTAAARESPPFDLTIEAAQGDEARNDWPTSLVPCKLA